MRSSIYHIVYGQRIEGPHPGLTGNCTDLRGDCTGLTGECRDLLAHLRAKDA